MLEEQRQVGASNVTREMVKAGARVHVLEMEAELGTTFPCDEECLAREVYSAMDAAGRSSL